MKNHITKIVFVCILVLAGLLRFVRLNDLPMGLSWDEAATGYNGYGIFINRRDEWLNKLPVTFKSFGDYKAAFAIYLDAGSTAIFGLNPFGIRFPMALAGVLTTITAYFILRSLNRSEGESLLAMFLVAISPWNIHYSRMAFESGIAVAAISWGLVFFLWSLKKKQWLLFSAVSFVLSLYAYHSPKIFLPFLFVILFWKFRKHLLHEKKVLFVSLIFAVLLLIPLAKESISGNASERLYMTSAIVDRHGLLPVGTILQNCTQNIFAHLDPRFMLLGKATTYRHGNGVFGVLSPIEALGVLLFIFFSFRKQISGQRWLFLIVLAGFLPAIISTEAPHSNRAHVVVPFIQLISAMGLWRLLQVKRMRYKAMILITGVSIVYGIWAIQTYVRVYSTVGVMDFQYGYLEATSIAKEQEKFVDRVYFTNAYGQAYIYILLTKKLTPIQFHQGALANYEIREINWNSDKEKKSALIVGTGKEIPAQAPGIIKEIFFPNGEVAFRIVKNEN